MARDDSIIKKLTAKKIIENDMSKSDAGHESSNGSLDGTLDQDAALMQAMHIIGDEMIPQNEPWVEKLSELVKEIYTSQKHIKLIGTQFGSQLICYALGGTLHQKGIGTSDAGENFIGKEVINLKPEFFK